MTGLDAHVVVHRNTRAGSPGFALDVALQIDVGETVALLGPNGAGKSTTIEALTGLLPIDAGHIRLSGRTLDDPVTDTFVPPELRSMGVVFQDYLLFEHMSVLDNVAFGLVATGTRKADAHRSANQWMDEVGLQELARRKPSQLSGGQAQRVALARALATQPDMLLLDEALAALDVSTRSELRRTLGTHLGEFAGPRLLITHDPTDAFLLADRIAVIEAGAITQLATPEEIRRRPATPYAAALAGTNLLRGRNDNGVLVLDDHERTLQTSDTSSPGPVLITIHPTAIALYAEQPHGSPRNSWQTTVASVEPLGDITRITLDDPLPLGVNITPASTAALGLAPGSPIWASVKATEISTTPVT